MMIRCILSFCFVVVYVNAIVCPGGSHQCSDDNTCCKISDTDYGCCPFSNAVCCDDLKHCCHPGHFCLFGACLPGSYNITDQPIVKKEEVPCGDSNYTCPSINACCLSDDGEFNGCCMEPDAVCCGGGNYCCPTHEDCDKENKNCYDRRYQSSASSMLNPLKPHDDDELTKLNEIDMSRGYDDSELANLNEIDASQGSPIICPDGTSECPGGCTCCQLPQGSWGCCPFPDATCCRDHLHCCPNEMTCSETSTSCQRSGFIMPSFKTLSAMKYGVNRN